MRVFEPRSERGHAVGVERVHAQGDDRSCGVVLAAQHTRAPITPRSPCDGIALQVLVIANGVENRRSILPLPVDPG